MPRSEPDNLVTAAEAAVRVAQLTGEPCAVGTIWSWATRGHIRRRGRRGRATLYDLREVDAWVLRDAPDLDA